MNRILACAVLLVPALAWAEPKTASEWFNEGENQYNIGDFDKAVAAFKQGFELETDNSKKSVYLYNVAQAYRQKKDCTDAQFFYKRFLALKDADTIKPLSPKKRAEVEELIKGLDDCAKQEAARAQQAEQLKQVAPPVEHHDSTPPPVTPPLGIVGDARTAPSKQVLVARLTGGVAKLSTGSLGVPIQATGALTGAYPIAIAPKLALEIGAAFTDTPIKFENMVTHAGNTAQMIAALADLGATYAATPKLALRGEVGLGVMLFSGASQSPWTGGAPTSGALAMLDVRAAASLDYALATNLVATVVPFAFSYSPPKSGLRSDIKSITAIDFMVGLGYRM